jgi:hypothetical protein
MEERASVVRSLSKKRQRWNTARVSRSPSSQSDMARVGRLATSDAVKDCGRDLLHRLAAAFLFLLQQQVSYSMK